MKSPKLSDDMISNLPDSILSYVLSFLPTVDAVATCVLSSKWKNLWTNLSILSFNDSEPPFRGRRFPNQISMNIKFANFINRVLHYQGHNSLVKFDFKCRENPKPYDISTWISVSIMKRVRELNLSVFTDGFILLPECFYNSVTLEVVKLIGNIKIKAPTLVNLPNLRNMELLSVDYEDGQSLSKLIVSCTSLDSLVVDWEDAEDVDVDEFTISSSTLRYLRYYDKMLNGEFDPPGFVQEDPPGFAHMSRRYLCCKTLEELHLYSVLIQGTFCLPNLRVLKLDSVDFENDDCARNFISSFASLESLVILDPNNICMLKISSSTLRDLKIAFPDNEDPGLGLVLDAPALQNLSLGFQVLKDFNIKDLPSLINAFVSLDFRQIDVHDQNYDNEMSILIHGLCNVKILSLTWRCMEGTIPDHKFPKFPKLTQLRMEVKYPAWTLLQQFIKNSNGLQDLVLVVNKAFREETNYRHTWKDPEIVPECLLSSFRRLYFFGLEGSEDELAMVKYLLKNTRGMQRMEIGVDPSLDNSVKIDLLQKLLKFRRGSEACEMSVCFDNSMSWKKVEERFGVRL